MECRFSLGLILLLQLLWLVVAKAEPDAQASASRQIVLVAFGECCSPALDSLQLRKLYLGIPVKINQCQLAPLRNRTDDRLGALFVQSVMSMAPRTYERRLLSGLFREGRPRPKEFTHEKTLLQAFRKTPCAVTYMWKLKAESIPGIKIVQVLWEGITDL